MQKNIYICDICKQQINVEVFGVDWLRPWTLNPSFRQYLRSDINEICKPCAIKIADYIESLIVIDIGI